jgi:chromosome segregation ATPase
MNKEAVKEKANQTIDEISNEIDDLKKKSLTVKEEAKEEFNQLLIDLKSKRDDLETKLSDLEAAADEKWDEAKEAFKSASFSFKEGLVKMKSIF